jgi:hypothetical protein
MFSRAVFSRAAARTDNLFWPWVVISKDCAPRERGSHQLLISINIGLQWSQGIIGGLHVCDPAPDPSRIDRDARGA